MNKKTKLKIRNPFVILLILILLFCIPLSIAWLLYKKHDIKGGSTNHGQLVTPPFSVALLKFRNDNAKGKWKILYLYPESCRKDCERGLYNIRQIRTATGKNMNRIERAVITYQNETSDGRLDKVIQTEFKGTHHITTNKDNFAKVIREHVKAPYALKSGTIYIVDPNGNVMMTYKPDADPSSIFNDLQKLLKVSQIG